MKITIFFIVCLMFPANSFTQELSQPIEEQQSPYINMNFNVSNTHDARSSNNTNATIEKNTQDKASFIIIIKQEQSSGIGRILRSLFSATLKTTTIIPDSSFTQTISSTL